METYKLVSETYLCGRFDLQINDIENIVQQGTLNDVYAYYDIDIDAHFWHLNPGVPYEILIHPKDCSDFSTSSSHPPDIVDLSKSGDDEPTPF